MAVEDVEGSSTVQELTGPDLLKYMLDRGMTRKEALELMLKHGHSPNKKKKGGTVSRKRGSSVSRKRGSKIMQGYKAGGKV